MSKAATSSIINSGTAKPSLEECIQIVKRVQKNIALQPALPTQYEEKFSYEYFLGVTLQAGVLTGLGTAATIINFSVVFIAPLLSTFLTPQVIGLVTLSTFLLYAIPWALIYMPAVASRVRDSIQKKADEKKGIDNKIIQLNANNSALNSAHEFLGKVLRSLYRHKNNNQTFTKEELLLALGAQLIWEAKNETKTSVSQHDKAKLGFLLMFVARNKDFETLSESLLPISALTHQVQIQDDMFTNCLSTKIENTENTYLRRDNNEIQPLQRAKMKRRRNDTQSASTNREDYSAFFAHALGLFNAIFGNAVGLSLAPLFILSPFLAIYGATYLQLNWYLAASLVCLFASAGFTAANGLTRQSIVQEVSFAKKEYHDHEKHEAKKQRSSNYYQHLDTYNWTLKFVERNSSIAYFLAIVMAFAVSSFNFQAGVMFIQLFLNPSFLVHPYQVAQFGINSYASLSLLELTFGWLGFALTFIAVTPLMASSIKRLTKSLSEGLMESRTGWFFTVVASVFNTVLWAWMMTKSGSPLHLLLPQLVIQYLPVIGIPAIFILSTALIYVSMKEAFDHKGRDFNQLCQEQHLNNVPDAHTYFSSPNDDNKSVFGLLQQASSEIENRNENISRITSI